MSDELKNTGAGQDPKQEAVIAELMARLKEAEKMVLLGNLMAGIAHEINTPLGALKSNCDLFVRAIEKMKRMIYGDDASVNLSDDPALAKLFEQIDQLNKINMTASERIESIVNNVRSYSRKSEQSPQIGVDVNHVIEGALSLALHELKNRVTVHKNYGTLPTIAAFPNHLSQMFLNLIVNASQAIEGRGEIWIASGLEQDTIVVTLQDSGKGIPPEKLEKVFEAGFTTKASGMGMGLVIVRETVTAHRGQIAVESELGTGTTFTIKLPVKRGD